jgi:predicted RNase H-like nuclease (RuvC/YqgF family)
VIQDKNKLIQILLKENSDLKSENTKLLYELKDLKKERFDLKRIIHILKRENIMELRIKITKLKCSVRYYQKKLKDNNVNINQRKINFID